MVLLESGGMMTQGCLFALTGEPGMAVQLITAGMTASQAGRSEFAAAMEPVLPGPRPCRSWATRRSLAAIGQAMEVMETTKETWQEPELHRVAGDLTLLLPNAETGAARRILSGLGGGAGAKGKSWECGRRSAWRGCGAIKARRVPLMICSPRFSGGLPKGSTQWT